MNASFASDAALEGMDLDGPTLAARLRALLEQGIHGLCFSAYAPGQSPADHHQLSEAQVKARLEIIAPHTQWIRTFACNEGNELAPPLAHEMGLKTLVGAWIDDDEEKNEAELERVIALGRAGHADLIAVGNEVLLREELSEDAIIRAIERVRAAVPGVPVGYVDAYYIFVQHPRLVAACDFLPINCYPFWESCPLEQSLGHVQEMVRRVQAVVGDKPVLIAETGWPTEGTPEGPAVPGMENAARYALSLIKWADGASVPLFWFSAFDEAWKVGDEGDCGAYWGFWDADGVLKSGE
ncbi:MAG: glycosyl hydrolase family 17 protein [Myxococcota bacterium]